MSLDELRALLGEARDPNLDNFDAIDTWWDHADVLLDVAEAAAAWRAWRLAGLLGTDEEAAAQRSLWAALDRLEAA